MQKHKYNINQTPEVRHGLTVIKITSYSFVLVLQNCQSKRCIYLIRRSDWMFFEYDCKTRTQKCYDRKTWWFERV